MKDGLRTLSGDEVITILGRFGFSVHSQRGSHVKLRRQSVAGVETLIIPKRDPVSKGTLREIYHQASHYISPDELHAAFYA